MAGMNLTKSKMRVHRKLMTVYSWFIRFLRTSSIRSINNRMFQASNTNHRFRSLDQIIYYRFKHAKLNCLFFRSIRKRMSFWKRDFSNLPVDATFLQKINRGHQFSNQIIFFCKLCRFRIDHIYLSICRIIKLFPMIFREFFNSFRLT